MSAARAVAVLGDVKVKFEGSTTRASYDGVLERDERVIAPAIPGVTATVQRRGIVVELKPRTFNETAAHFASIAKSVDWPLDEPDID
jgi:hypothetical protein